METAKLFVVMVPHRDSFPLLEAYRRSLFARGVEGAFSFPMASPLAQLARPLDPGELKTAAAELRKLMGEKKFVLSAAAECNGWICSGSAGHVRFLGPSLELPPLSFPADAVLQYWEKPILAPAIFPPGDKPDDHLGQFADLFQLSGLTGISRAAALANLSFKAIPDEQNTETAELGSAEFSFFEGNYSFIWEFGPLFWLPC